MTDKTEVGADFIGEGGMAIAADADMAIPQVTVDEDGPSSTMPTSTEGNQQKRSEPKHISNCTKHQWATEVIRGPKKWNRKPPSLIDKETERGKRCRRPMALSMTRITMVPMTMI